MLGLYPGYGQEAMEAMRFWLLVGVELAECGTYRHHFETSREGGDGDFFQPFSDNAIAVFAFVSVHATTPMVQ